jgi:hypothetical protein
MASRSFSSQNSESYVGIDIIRVVTLGVSLGVSCRMVSRSFSSQNSESYVGIEMISVVTLGVSLEARVVWRPEASLRLIRNLVSASGRWASSRSKNYSFLSHESKVQIIGANVTCLLSQYALDQLFTSCQQPGQDTYV